MAKVIGIDLGTTNSVVAYMAVSYTHLRAHETPEHIVCRLLLEKKKNIFYPVYSYHRSYKYTT